MPTRARTCEPLHVSHPQLRAKCPKPLWVKSWANEFVLPHYLSDNGCGGVVGDDARPKGTRALGMPLPVLAPSDLRLFHEGACQLFFSAWLAQGYALHFGLARPGTWLSPGRNHLSIASHFETSTVVNLRKLDSFEIPIAEQIVEGKSACSREAERFSPGRVRFYRWKSRHLQQHSGLLGSLGVVPKTVLRSSSGPCLWLVTGSCAH